MDKRGRGRPRYSRSGDRRYLHVVKIASLVLTTKEIVLLSVEKFRRAWRGRPGFLFAAIFSLSLIAAATLPACGQSTVQATTAGQPAGNQPTIITLDEAIKRAEANEPAYAAMSAESRAAGLDRLIARGGLLPSVVYHNQALYTQTDRGQTVPRFIANNAVREYASQVMVNETLGLNSLAGLHRADAAAARAAAELGDCAARSGGGRDEPVLQLHCR